MARSNGGGMAGTHARLKCENFAKVKEIKVFICSIAVREGIVYTYVVN
jgi:hypothetical protein